MQINNMSSQINSLKPILRLPDTGSSPAAKKTVHFNDDNNTIHLIDPSWKKTREVKALLDRAIEIHSRIQNAFTRITHDIGEGLCAQDVEIDEDDIEAINDSYKELKTFTSIFIDHEGANQRLLNQLEKIHYSAQNILSSGIAWVNCAGIPSECLGLSDLVIADSHISISPPSSPSESLDLSESRVLTEPPLSP